MRIRFFKIGNKVFEYNLPARAFHVYAFLISKMNSLQMTIASYEQIAAACNISAKTAQAAVNDLQASGLATKVNRYNALGYARNKYWMKNLAETKGNQQFRWFPIEYDIFRTAIKSTDFLIYGYIKSCMGYRPNNSRLNGHKTPEAFPSLSAISSHTGVSRGRTAQAIEYLKQFSFLNKIKRHYRNTKAYRHNRYLQFRVKEYRKRLRTYLQGRVRSLHLSFALYGKLFPIQSILRTTAIVKRLLDWIGGDTEITKQSLYPQSIITIKKE